MPLELSETSLLYSLVCFVGWRPLIFTTTIDPERFLRTVSVVVCIVIEEKTW